MDIHNGVKFSRAISPAAAVSDNTAIVSQILDTAGFEDNTLVLNWGSLADADVTTTVLLEESDASDMTGAAAVADADMLGTEADVAQNFADDNTVTKLSYKGRKRYLRATIAPANNSGALYLAATWAQSGSRTYPLA